MIVDENFERFRYSLTTVFVAFLAVQRLHRSHSSYIDSWTLLIAETSQLCATLIKIIELLTRERFLADILKPLCYSVMVRSTHQRLNLNCTSLASSEQLITHFDNRVVAASQEMLHLGRIIARETAPLFAMTCRIVRKLIEIGSRLKLFENQLLPLEQFGKKVWKLRHTLLLGNAEVTKAVKDFDFVKFFGNKFQQDFNFCTDSTDELKAVGDRACKLTHFYHSHKHVSAACSSGADRCVATKRRNNSAFCSIEGG
uniref:Uncharacterized protein n=1 Tax=Romanomermis culicivorax TaxID=13658 RepID=A0A915L9L7_ROMCU